MQNWQAKFPSSQDRQVQRNNSRITSIIFCMRNKRTGMATDINITPRSVCPPIKSQLGTSSTVSMRTRQVELIVGMIKNLRVDAAAIQNSPKELKWRRPPLKTNWQLSARHQPNSNKKRNLSTKPEADQVPACIFVPKSYIA